MVEHQRVAVGVGEERHVADAGVEDVAHERHAARLELRAAGAAGATSLRGIWGYHGDHRPHGDSFWQLRRRVPVVTVLVDRPERIQRWFAIVDALTDETGLVTAEAVPAYRATAAALTDGGLDLAAL